MITRPVEARPLDRVARRQGTPRAPLDQPFGLEPLQHLARGGPRDAEHLGDALVQAGVFNKAIYFGLIQFDLSQIPAGAKALYASFDLMGARDDQVNGEGGGVWHADMCGRSRAFPAAVSDPDALGTPLGPPAEPRPPDPPTGAWCRPAQRSGRVARRAYKPDHLALFHLEPFLYIRRVTHEVCVIVHITPTRVGDINCDTSGPAVREFDDPAICSGQDRRPTHGQDVGRHVNAAAAPGCMISVCQLGGLRPFDRHHQRMRAEIGGV